MVEAKHVPLTVFYSWQTDAPAGLNRNFIEDALKRALKKINADAEVVNAARGEEVKLDKDTIGFPGTPPIVDTIFGKIDQCAVFVPDLTFVARTDAGRPTPNANVLIEYGWALKSRGHQRIVAVMNEAFGAPSETNLPFNMRHLRWPLRYTLRDGDDAPSNVRPRLVDQLVKAIRSVLENAPVESAPRPMFEESPSTYDKAVYFQKNEKIAIREGPFTERDEECFVPVEGAKMFVRLMPTERTAELSAPEACVVVKKGRLWPFSLQKISGGEWYDRNKYGAIVFRAHNNRPTIKHLTQLFKNTELWGVSDELDRIKREAGFGMLVSGYEEAFVRTLDNYLNFARGELKSTLPLRLVAGITGIKGFKMAAKSGMSFADVARYGGRAVEPDVILETTVDDWNAPPTEVLKPFFKRVWDAFGLQRPEIPT